MRRHVMILPLCVLGACSTPGPTPSAWAAREVPAVELDAAGRAAVADHTEAAWAALGAGRSAEAVARASAALSIDPRTALARAILGRVLLDRAVREHPAELAGLERAEGELLMARRFGGKHPRIELLYSQFLEASGQLSRAAYVLDGLLEVVPNDLPCLRAAARLHFELSHERRAVELLATLVHLRPQEGGAVYRLAFCHFRLAEAVARGDTDLRLGVEAAARQAFLGAADIYRDYRNLAPRDLEGYLGEAAARFRALAIVPDGPHTVAELAQVRAILAAAARADPTSPAPAHNLALIHQQRGASDQARAAYEQALRLDAEFLPSLLNLARLLDAQGDKAAARDLCRRALALGPTASEARRLRAYLE